MTADGDRRRSALVNARGTPLGGGLQVVVTTVKVLSLLAIALLPFIMLGCRPIAARRSRRASRMEPDLAGRTGRSVNWVAFGGALVGVFWAYHGWMNIAPVAEEVKNPQRNIPLALLTGVGIIIVLYVSVNLAYYLIIPGREIAALKDRTVAGEFSVRVLGPVGLLFASTAIMISVFGSLNGNLLVGPRLLYAMGQDGLAPRAVAAASAVSQRRRPPRRSSPAGRSCSCSWSRS